MHTRWRSFRGELQARRLFGCDQSKIPNRVRNHDFSCVPPRSGTFGMEAVARQFATDEHVMVIRNGWFR